MWDVLKDDDDNNNVLYKLEQLHHRDPIISRQIHPKCNISSYPISLRK